MYGKGLTCLARRIAESKIETRWCRCYVVAQGKILLEARESDAREGGICTGDDSGSYTEGRLALRC